jgi:hypothetical protein
MDNEADPSIGSGAGKTTGVLFVALLLAIVTLGGAVFLYSPPAQLPSLELGYWIPRSEDLTRQRIRDEAQKKMVVWGEEETQLLEALQRFGHVEVQRGGKGSGEEYREVLTLLEQQAHNYYHRYRGEERREHYRGMGLILCDHFEMALRAFLSDLRSGDVALTEGYEPSASPSAKELHGLGGTILKYALRTGLLNTRGEMTPEAFVIMRFLYLTRWARLLYKATPVSTLLSSFEELTLLKWKVEAHAQLKLNERIGYAREVQRIDSTYPLHHVLGILLWRSGLGEEALVEMGLAVRESPDDSVLVATEKFMRETLETQGVNR